MQEQCLRRQEVPHDANQPYDRSQVKSMQKSYISFDDSNKQSLADRERLELPTTGSKPLLYPTELRSVGWCYP